jgi:hypothetical protein
MPEPSVASALSPTKSSVSWREGGRLGETAPLWVEVYFRLFRIQLDALLDETRLE